MRPVIAKTESSEPMGSCLARLRSWTTSNRGSVSMLARHVLRNPESVRNASISDFANQCRTSVSSVSRFCTTIGYAGYKEFQLDLSASLAQQPEPALDAFDENASPADIVRHIFEVNRRSLTDTERLIASEPFLEVAREIHEARRVCLIGIGASGLSAQQAATRFTSLGLQAVAFTDPYLQVFFTANLGAQDVVIGVSHTGRTRLVVAGIEAAGECGARTVALTNYPQSPLARACDRVLLTACEERRINAAVSSSQIAQLCLVDALYFVVGGWRSRGARALAEAAEDRVRRLLR